MRGMRSMVPAELLERSELGLLGPLLFHLIRVRARVSVRIRVRIGLMASLSPETLGEEGG